MSTHNIGFYEDLTKFIISIIIKYHQISTLFLLLWIPKMDSIDSTGTICQVQQDGPMWSGLNIIKAWSFNRPSAHVRPKLFGTSKIERKVVVSYRL